MKLLLAKWDFVVSTFQKALGNHMYIPVLKEGS